MKDFRDRGFRASFEAAASAPVFLTAILGVGLALRLFRLSAKELWLDEAHSVFIAGASLAGVVENLKHDGHPPLYFALVLGWKTLFGESELSVRMLSVMFGLASLAAIYWLGSRLISPRLGLAAAFVAAISPLHVYYSQEARMYIMLAFLSTMSTGFLWLALKHNKTKYWWAYSAAAGCLVYTHVFGWFALPAGNTFLLLWKQHRQLFKKLLLHQAIVVLFFLPWLPILPLQTSQAGLWMRPWWQATPPALAIPKTLECFGAGGNYPRYLSFFHVSQVRFIAGAVFALMGVISLSPVRDRSFTTDSQGKGPFTAGLSDVRAVKIYLLLNLFMPLAIPYAISFVKPIYLVGRNDLIAYPFYALLIGIGIVKLARFAWVGLLLLCLTASYSFSRYYSAQNDGYDKETVAYLAREAKEGDAVIVMGLRYCTIDYYMRREGVRFRLMAYPASMLRHPGWIDFRLGQEQLTRDAIEVTVSAIAETPPGRPVWLLLYPFNLAGASGKNDFERVIFDELNRHFLVSGKNEEFGVVSLRQKGQTRFY